MRVYICMYVCMYACMHVCMYKKVYVFLYIHIHISSWRKGPHPQARMIFVCVHTYSNSHAYIYIETHMYRYTRKYVYIYIYIYLRIHVRTVCCYTPCRSAARTSTRHPQLECRCRVRSHKPHHISTLPNFPLNRPKRHAIETIRPLGEVRWGVLVWFLNLNSKLGAQQAT